MLRGHLKAEYRRCGKVDCPCGKDDGKRHGPYYYLVWQADGRRMRRYVPKEQVEDVRAEVAERRALVGAVRRIVGEARQACRGGQGAIVPPEPPAPAAPPAPAESPVEKGHTAAQAWAKLMAQARG